MLDTKIPPPIVTAIAAAAMWGAAPFGPSLPLSDGGRLGVAIALAVAGLAFAALGVLAFRAARTTVDPLRPERASALVSGGIYRVTRNPMYVGMLLLLLAWAAHLSAVLPLLGPIAFVLYINRFQIVPEERALERAFGASFTHYAARVRRWL
jgi:protein-S-isoprenylcysteine O-methyltransferase Ste14